MIELEDSTGLDTYIGKTLGTSKWVTIDQAMIDRFADTTGDHQWIHVDAARAARELPEGKTIAHGYLLLSLLPRLNAQIYRLKSRKRSLNYGLNNLRFIGQVRSGARVRLIQRVESVSEAKGGKLICFTTTLEIEGEDCPALVAETMTLVFES